MGYDAHFLSISHLISFRQNQDFGEERQKNKQTSSSAGLKLAVFLDGTIVTAIAAALLAGLRSKLTNRLRISFGKPFVSRTLRRS